VLISKISSDLESRADNHLADEIETNVSIELCIQIEPKKKNSRPNMLFQVANLICEVKGHGVIQHAHSSVKSHRKERQKREPDIASKKFPSVASKKLHQK